MVVVVDCYLDTANNPVLHSSLPLKTKIPRAHFNIYSPELHAL